MNEILKSLALKIPTLRRLRDQRNLLAQQLVEAHAATQADRGAFEAATSAMRSHVDQISRNLQQEQAAHAQCRSDLDAVSSRLREYDSLQAAGCLLRLDCGYRPRQRAWEHTPAIERIRALIEAGRPEYRRRLESIANMREFFRRIAHRFSEGLPPDEPVWLNDFFEGLDAMSLCALLVERNPRTYVEIGSGHSTRFARKTIREFGLRTRIVSIDPYPRADIDRICDEVVRQPLEDLPIQFFLKLTGEDLLLADNSHRAFQNSDVAVFFTEILASLPKALVYGLHDIFLPMDYPKHWADRYYNEQYLMAAYLLGGADGDRILMPNCYLSARPDYMALLSPLWDDDGIPGVHYGCGMFWMRRSN